MKENKDYESVNNSDGCRFLSDSAISSVVSDNYSVYVTPDGEVKVEGSGVLAEKFSGFSGAFRVFLMGKDAFAILSVDGSVYAFGDNTGELIEKRSREIIYSKDNIPFCYSTAGGHSVTTPYMYEKEKGSSYAETNIMYLKRIYFSSRICGDAVYEKYKEIMASSDGCDIKWDISIDDFSHRIIECHEDQEVFDYYNDGTAYNRYFLSEYKGESSVVAYKTNDYICEPVLIDPQKASGL